MEPTERGTADPMVYLAALADHYEAAYRVARQLAVGFANSQDRDQFLQQLRQHLTAIASWENQHVEIRNLLTSTPKSAAARQELARVRTLIEKVLQAVNAAEHAAVSARSQLTPQLDEQTKARQVKKAYAAAVRQAGGG